MGGNFLESFKIVEGHIPELIELLTMIWEKYGDRIARDNPHYGQYVFDICCKKELRYIHVVERYGFIRVEFG